MDNFDSEIIDFLFIGSGIASLRALYNVDTKKFKCKVVSLGNGSSPFIHGISIPISKDDSFANYYDEFLISSHYQCDKSLAKTLIYNSLKVVDFIKSIGFDFNKDKNNNYEVLKPLGMKYPRVVSIKNELGHIIQQYLREIKRNDVEFINGKLIKIFKKDDVFASLIKINNEQIKVIYSKGIFIGSGGFSKLYKFSTNSFDLSADAIYQAYEIGASLCDLEFVQFEPSVATYPSQLIGKSVITTLFFNGATLENKDGERFMFKYFQDGERVNKDLMSKAIQKEINDGKSTAHNGVYFNATGVDKKLLLTSYKSYYDRYKNVGIDISKEKMEIAPGAHTTLGGIKADKECKTCVNGLFVAGEAMGGVHGANRMGGCAGLETFVFGDIAGKSISSYLSNYQNELDISSIKKEVDSFIYELEIDDKDYKDSYRVLSEVLNEDFGVIRNIDKMKNGLKEIEKLISTINKNKQSINKISILSNLSLARLMMLSALNRKESVGCHYIEDNNENNNDLHYQIVINKNFNLRKENL